MLNIFNMQLSRGTVKVGCFSSLMQKQGKKTFIIKTERLSAVLSREGRTKRKHQWSSNTRKATAKTKGILHTMTFV